MYKSLDPTDITQRKFKVFKNWSCDQNTISNLGIIIQDGVSGSGTFYPASEPTNSDGSYTRLVWSSINHIYYASANTENQANNFYLNIFDKNKIQYVSRSIDDSIRVLNIPTRVYGEQIKPGSIKIVSGTGEIYLDDNNYNLYLSGSTPRQVIGNVFYDTGQIVISSQVSTSIFDVFDLSFQSTIEITELEVVCNVLESEFNYSTNITAQSGSTGFYIPIFASASFKPAITTIGLYNDDNELLMVGKLGRPFIRNYDLDTAFVLRIDL